MDIKTIAYIVYILMIVVHSLVMTFNYIKVHEPVYWVTLLCIITAYICGMVKGGAFD